MKFKGWRELRALIKVQDLVQSIVIWLLAAVAMHEAGHAAAVKFFGGRILVDYDVHWLFFWTGGHGEWAKCLPPTAPWYAAPIVYLWGGFIVWLYFMWAYINESDLENKLGQLLWGWMNLFYSLVEITLAWNMVGFYYSWRGVAEALGAGVGVWFWMWRDAKIF